MEANLYIHHSLLEATTPHIPHYIIIRFHNQKRPNMQEHTSNGTHKSCRNKSVELKPYLRRFEDVYDEGAVGAFQA